jgi:hypothetical protein
VVPLSVHEAPWGTRRLSTVLEPMVPRQARSSARPTPVPRVKAKLMTIAMAAILLIQTSSLDPYPVFDGI